MAERTECKASMFAKFNMQANCASDNTDGAWKPVLSRLTRQSNGCAGRCLRESECQRKSTCNAGFVAIQAIALNAAISGSIFAAGPTRPGCLSGPKLPTRDVRSSVATRGRPDMVQT